MNNFDVGDVPLARELGLVCLPQFIQSSRDAGYSSPASAVAELVDNAIQAGASCIEVSVLERTGEGLELSVADDGRGMGSHELVEALRFGGSSRYDDRRGLGRYGMGLPNSSLSQARLLEVGSVQRGAPALWSHLDLDQIVVGRQVTVPIPAPVEHWRPPRGAAHGTCVRWRRCDRLAGQPLRSLLTGLELGLAQTFRYFLWDGLKLLVNGREVVGDDPLLLDRRSPRTGGTAFGEPLVLSVRVAGPGGETCEGDVVVRFCELPVHAWGGMTLAEKRKLGIPRGAGVSIVRAGRQVDYGWHFLGEKRKESYDDWWRCEVRFEPILDELFGLTYTKQHVFPTPQLLDILTPQLEMVARALNGRARRAHQTLKSRERFSRVEMRARQVEARQVPLPLPVHNVEKQALLDRVSEAYTELRQAPVGECLEIRLVEDDLGPAPVYDWVHTPGRLVVVLNTVHPLYQKVYAPLGGVGGGDSRLRAQLELLMLALARGEAATGGEGLARYRQAWSAALAELLKEEA